MSKRIKGVIFDMDGVMIDSYEFHCEAWHNFAERYGVDFPDEDIKRSFGRRNEEVLGTIFNRQLSEEEILCMSREKESLYRELHKKCIEAAPGLMDFLKDLKRADIKMAIGSSAPIENIEFVIESLGLDQYIEAYVHSGMIERGKPEPDVFLKAAEMIKLPPEDCVVFEDSFPGMEAGLRAGMKVIAVATTHRKGDIKGVHGIIKDFTGLNAESLEKMLDS